TLLEQLSGGQILKVYLCKFELGNYDFIILDEPTNNLDLSTRKYVYELIENWKKGLIVISHDKKLLNLMDSIYALSKNNIKIYSGNYDFYVQQKSIEENAVQEKYKTSGIVLKEQKHKRNEVLERQEKLSIRGAKNSENSGLPRITLGLRKMASEQTRGQIKDKHDALLEEAEKNFNAAKAALPLKHKIHIDLSFTCVPSHKKMISCLNINYFYPNSYPRYLWEKPISFEVYGPERIALTGKNGTGKSTLLSMLMQQIKPTQGKVFVGSKKIAFLDQKISILKNEKNILENLKEISVKTEEELKNLLGRFLFYGNDSHKQAGSLSGGERMRAGLACLLSQEQAPQILILDEPTNNLDIDSLDILIGTINNFKGTLLVVSHDESFLQEINITRILNLE
ncbi:MAG: ATP-binding cassette domain-containing protein, partial [Silvanigrellaceae bacterium]|nr:ATP-binding cassette domain-containing protein [Silvanigrellaceae bacterium]